MRGEALPHFKPLAVAEGRGGRATIGTFPSSAIGQTALPASSDGRGLRRRFAWSFRSVRRRSPFSLYVFSLVFF